MRILLRRRAESNRRIEILQISALPLGYQALLNIEITFIKRKHILTICRSLSIIHFAPLMPLVTRLILYLTSCASIS